MPLFIKKTTLFLTFFCLGAVGLFAAKAKDTAPKGAGVLEPVALAASIGYLDGPRHQAIAVDSGRKAANDPDGNWFFMSKLSTSELRYLDLKTNMVGTIVGDNRWGSNLGITEGPAAYFPNMIEPPMAGDQSVLGIGMIVYGYPLKGEEYGSVYVYSIARRIYRLFKNKEEGGRWWFKALGKVGGAKPPKKTGEIAKVADIDFSHSRIGERWITHGGCLYKYDEKKGTIECLLTPEYYLPKVQDLVKAGKLKWSNKGKLEKKADRMILSEDGTMYVMHPWREGHVFKVSKDLSKFEHIVQQDPDLKGWNLDGPGLNTTWHCGPSYIQTSNNLLLLRAIDSVTVRRYYEGRVSFLHSNGEWRENKAGMSRRDNVPIGGMGYKPADYGLPYIYIHYGGATLGNDLRMYRYGPVDFTKPTSGSLAKAVQKKGDK